MRAETHVSERRACRVLGLSRSVLKYTSQRKDDGLQQRLIELAGERRRFGYRRLHILVEREGFEVNLKRVHRLYRQAGLAVRQRRKRARVAVGRDLYAQGALVGQHRLAAAAVAMMAATTLRFGQVHPQLGTQRALDHVHGNPPPVHLAHLVHPRDQLHLHVGVHRLLGHHQARMPSSRPQAHGPVARGHSWSAARARVMAQCTGWRGRAVHRLTRDNSSRRLRRKMLWNGHASRELSFTHLAAMPEERGHGDGHRTIWRARRDSNPRPLPSEGNTLSS